MAYNNFSSLLARVFILSILLAVAGKALAGRGNPKVAKSEDMKQPEWLLSDQSAHSWNWEHLRTLAALEEHEQVAVLFQVAMTHLSQTQVLRFQFPTLREVFHLQEINANILELV